jgi:ParB family chromosome partitioning protein
MLGRQDIPVNVVDLDEMRAELAMLDENLFRNDGTVLERAEWLKRRKEIYEALYPETERGGTPGNQHSGKKRKNEIISFYQDTANKMDVSPRTIQQGVLIAAGLASDIRETSCETADNPR